MLLTQPNLDYIKQYSVNKQIFDISKCWPHIVAHVKVPVWKTTVDTRMLQDEKLILEWILSLLDIGGVESEKTTFFSEDYNQFHGASIQRSLQKSIFYYCLKERHFRALQKSYILLRKRIRNLGILPSELNSIQIAFERYREGLMQSSFQKQIFSAVMGLEAIYTQKGPDTSYSLRMRASKMLSFLGKEDVREILKLAYDIRSDYAHGNTNAKKLEKKVLKFERKQIDFSRRALDILRISILGVLIFDFKNKNNLAEFHSMLDLSMISRNESPHWFIENLRENIDLF